MQLSQNLIMACPASATTPAAADGLQFRTSMFREGTVRKRRYARWVERADIATPEYADCQPYYNSTNWSLVARNYRGMRAVSRGKDCYERMAQGCQLALRRVILVAAGHFTEAEVRTPHSMGPARIGGVKERR